MAVIAGSFSSSIYFAQDSSTVLVLSSMDLAFIGVSENVLSTITLELFPTTLRYFYWILRLLKNVFLVDIPVCLQTGLLKII